METIGQTVSEAFTTSKDNPLLFTLDTAACTSTLGVTGINHTSWASISWRTFATLAAMTFSNQSYCLN